MPAQVVNVMLPPQVAVDVREVLPVSIGVHHADTPSAAVRLVERHANVCLLCHVPSTASESMGMDLIRLRAQFPLVPWIAIFIEGHSDSRWALRLGKAGVTELVLYTQAIPADELRQALMRLHADSIAIKLWKIASLRLDDSLIAVLKPALRLAHAPISMVRFASATGWHERTLRKYCTQASLPSPQWVAGWARLLVAAYYLDEPGRTVQGVAELLAFPSAVSLANQVRRYSGFTPTALRARGATQTVARLIEERLQPVPRSHPPARPFLLS